MRRTGSQSPGPAGRYAYGAVSTDGAGGAVDRTDSGRYGASPQGARSDEIRSAWSLGKRAALRAVDVDEQVGLMNNAGYDDLMSARAKSYEVHKYDGSVSWCLRPCFCCGRVTRRTGIGIFCFMLLGFIGIMAGIGYTVIAPVYVRDRIDATTLSFTSMTISNPVTNGPPPSSLTGAPNDSRDSADSSRQLRSGSSGDSVGDAASTWGFTISVSAVLSGLEPVDGTLEAFPVTLSFGGSDVATFTMPAISAKAGADNYVKFAAPVTVLDLESFTEFGDAILQYAAVTCSLRGSATVSTQVGGLTVSVAGVDFLKSVTFPGAAGLTQSTVPVFSLARSNNTAVLADLTVSLVNPSIVGIASLGDLQVGVYYKGFYMGSVLGRNASLAPGATNLTLSGQLFSSNLAATDELISGYLAGRLVTVTAQGEQCPTTNPLFQDAVLGLKLTASLNGGGGGSGGGGSSAPQLIQGINVDGMFLQPQGLSSVGIMLNVTVTVSNLLGPATTLDVTSVALNCSLEGQGQQLGSLIVPTTPVAPMSTHSYSSGSGSGSARALALPSAATARVLAITDDPALPLVNVTLQVAASLAIAASADRFSDFVLAFLTDPTVTIGLVSSAPGADAITIGLSCALGPLTVSIPLEARTQVAGIGGFPYVSVDAFSVTGTSADPPAILTALTVTILNPSPATFPLGENATLGLYIGAQRLGYSQLFNRTLQPGRNTLQLVGIVAPPPSALPAVSSLFSSYLIGQNGTVQVNGETVDLGGGQPTPEWLQSAVQNISLAATLPGLDPAAAAQLLVNTTVLSLTLDFSGDPGSPIVGGSVRGVLQLPFTIPVTVGLTNVSLDFVSVTTNATMASLSLVNQVATLYPCNSTDSCAAAGPPVPLSAARPIAHRLTSSSGLGIPAVQLSPVGVLVINLGPGSLSVSDTAAFADLITQVLTQSSADVILRGTASPTVGTAVGDLAISGVPINQALRLAGMANLTSPPVVVTGGTLTNTTATTVSLGVSLNVTNPSTLSGNLGPVTLYIGYQGVQFVSTHVDELIVGPGLNVLNAGGLLTVPDPVTRPADNALALTVLSRFLSGKSSNVSLSGGPDSSPIPLLQPAFATFAASSVFPGIPTRLIENGTLYIDIFNQQPHAPGDLWVNNPLDVQLRLLDANLTVYYCKNETDADTCEDATYDTPDGPVVGYSAPIGFFYDGSAGPLADDPITVPPKSEYRSKRYPILLLATSDEQLAVFGEVIVDGDAITKINGTLTAQLQRNDTATGGGVSEPITATIFFEQTQLKLYIASP